MIFNRLFTTIIFLIIMNAMNAQFDTKNLFFAKEIEGSYEEVYQKVETSLKAASFGIVTDLSMDQKFKEKLDVTIDTYKVLGICNPKIAYEAIQIEENIGVFLPCTLIIKKKGENLYEVVTFNPAIMMAALNNPELDKVAERVKEDLKKIINSL